jgi:hypothetical protein
MDYESDNSGTPQTRISTTKPETRLENPNELTFNDESINKNNFKNSKKNKKIEDSMNEDNATEIIEIEFDELKQWIKFKMRHLKNDYLDMIDSIKLKSLDDDYNY